MRTYGNGGLQQALVAVVRLPGGQTVSTASARRALSGAFGALGREPGLRVVSYASTGDRKFASADGRTTFALVFTPVQPVLGDRDLGPPIAASLTARLPAGWQVRVTGLDELELGSHTHGPAVLTETLIGGLGALIVLALVFGSLLAIAPLIVAVASILTTFLIVYGLAELTQVSTYVEYLVALIGLGVAIDYSLLLVTRWREERARGHSPAEAVELAMHSQPAAVIISGATVAIGLLSMVVLPVPALRSRLRRAARSAGQRGGVAEPAPRDPGVGRPASGLAAHPHRHPRGTPVVGLGEGRDSLALGRGRRRPRDHDSARRRRLQLAARHSEGLVAS